MNKDQTDSSLQVGSSEEGTLIFNRFANIHIAKYNSDTAVAKRLMYKNSRAADSVALTCALPV